MRKGSTSAPRSEPKDPSRPPLYSTTVERGRGILVWPGLAWHPVAQPAARHIKRRVCGRGQDAADGACVAHMQVTNSARISAKSVLNRHGLSLFARARLRRSKYPSGRLCQGTKDTRDFPLSVSVDSSLPFRTSQQLVHTAHPAAFAYSARCARKRAHTRTCDKVVAQLIAARLGLGERVCDVLDRAEIYARPDGVARDGGAETSGESDRSLSCVQ